VVSTKQITVIWIKMKSEIKRTSSEYFLGPIVHSDNSVLLFLVLHFYPRDVVSAVYGNVAGWVAGWLAYVTRRYCIKTAKHILNPSVIW